jgi:hypothetical protein
VDVNVKSPWFWIAVIAILLVALAAELFIICKCDIEAYYNGEE